MISKGKERAIFISFITKTTQMSHRQIHMSHRQLQTSCGWLQMNHIQLVMSHRPANDYRWSALLHFCTPFFNDDSGAQFQVGKKSYRNLGLKINKNKVIDLESSVISSAQLSKL